MSVLRPIVIVMLNGKEFEKLKVHDIFIILTFSGSYAPACGACCFFFKSGTNRIYSGGFFSCGIFFCNSRKALEPISDSDPSDEKIRGFQIDL